MQVAPVELVSLVRETVANCASRLQAGGMTIEATLPKRPVTVSGDVHRLRQVLDNLIENALHYAAVGAWLGIALRQEGRVAVLTVSDAQLVQTMRFFASRMKLVVEPTGCLGFAAAHARRHALAGKRVGIVLSGGNVDIASYGTMLAD